MSRCAVCNNVKPVNEDGLCDACLKEGWRLLQRGGQGDSYGAIYTLTQKAPKIA